MDNKFPVDDIELYGSTRMEFSDIAIILGIEEKEFKAEYKKKDVVYKAYKKGWLITEVEIRKSIIKAAKDGSTPAQNLFYEKIAGDKFSRL